MSKSKKGENQYYLVSKDVLPDVIIKVLETKEYIEKTGIPVHKAVKEVGISRTSYYKYANSIFPFNYNMNNNKFEMVIVVKDNVGIMAKISKVISEDNYNILTIQQSTPINNTTNIRVLLESKEDAKSIDKLIQDLKSYEFVENINMLTAGN